MARKHMKIIKIKHQGNTNQTHNEKAPYTCQNSYYQKEKEKKE